MAIVNVDVCCRVYLTVHHCDPHTEFDCTSAGEHCIPLSQTCDGHNNCGDNADEDGNLCSHLNGISFIVLDYLYSLSLP